MSSRWNLQSIPIGRRLRISFAAALVLMLLGSVLSVWQFRHVRGYGARLSRVEQRVGVLLRLNNNLLTLMGHLHRAADNRDSAHFESEARTLLDAFQRQSAGMNAALDDIAGESDRHRALVGGIKTLLDSLPARISSLAELAQRQDWIVLHARLLNQTDSTDDVLEALMQQVDADLTVARKHLMDDLERAQDRAVEALVITALLSLTAAVVVGTIVTSSITQPLAALDAGARALAAGNFEHRVPVKGNDELTHLALVFNQTSAEVARLFEEVRREHANAAAAQAALKERAQELARANADLEQFAYSATHDLKEPLRIISLYSQLLHRKYAGRLDHDAEEFIGYLFRAARQMEQLITDLLAYTRTANVNKAEEARTDANAVLDKVLTTLELQIRECRCRLTVEPLPIVRAHEVHVHQLLQNLIGNSLKYRSDNDPQIHVGAERKNGDWLFTIRDNGIGIDPQYARQIFGIFKRLHGQKYPGTGIGLAICQRIVEGYGGRIWVESQLGQGATFRFTLPAAS